MTDWTALSLLDDAQARRGDLQWVRSAWAEENARLITVGSGEIEVTADGRLALARAEGEYDLHRHYLLGLLEGRPLFATITDRPGLTTLRTVLDDLRPAELQAAFAAVGLAGWHAGAQYCSRCGAPTTVIAAGRARQCTGCGRELYPRTDPAVIVAILDAERRLLLGRQPSWAPGRHSVFAGFVEVGESLEQAVHREMAEEVGLALTDIRYLGSQPWPFPRSLMVSFLARASDPRLTIATGEIESARWFSPDELRHAIAAGEVTLPPLASIARRMIESWLAGELG